MFRDAVIRKMLSHSELVKLRVDNSVEILSSIANFDDNTLSSFLVSYAWPPDGLTKLFKLVSASSTNEEPGSQLVGLGPLVDKFTKGGLLFDGTKYT